MSFLETDRVKINEKLKITGSFNLTFSTSVYINWITVLTVKTVKTVSTPGVFVETVLTVVKTVAFLTQQF